MQIASSMGMGSSSITALGTTARKYGRDKEVRLAGGSRSIAEPFFSQ
jgi:hypothetical protein